MSKFLDMTGLTHFKNKMINVVNSGLNKKVDKVTGKSLISDTEIQRLAGVTNYDDSGVKASIQMITPYNITFGTPEVLVNTTTLSFSKDRDYSWYTSREYPFSGVSVSALFDINAMYKVTWDGVVYEAFFELYTRDTTKLDTPKQKGFYDWGCIGNITDKIEDYYSRLSITATPFCIEYDFHRNDGEIAVFSFDTATSHTIKIEKIPFTKTKNISPAFTEYVDPTIKSVVISEGKGGVGSIQGGSSLASGLCSHAVGEFCIASGRSSHAEGLNCTADGYASHAEGYACTASSTSSHAEGYACTASGYYSHAEGATCTASGNASHAEGYTCTASSACSHAEGYSCTASGHASHAEGQFTVASGGLSHAGGNKSEASNNISFTHGNFTKATQLSQFTVGYANDPQADSIFEVGNGLLADGTPCSGGSVEPTTRQNAFAVKQDGSVEIQTSLKIKKSDGTLITLTADNLEKLLKLI